MTREDFVFSIGFQGEVAIVDGKASKQNKGLNSIQLAEKGLFRAAFCSALFENNEDDMNIVIQKYKESGSANIKNIDDMKRILGVYSVPENIKKSTVIN